MSRNNEKIRGKEKKKLSRAIIHNGRKDRWMNENIISGENWFVNEYMPQQLITKS